MVLEVGCMQSPLLNEIRLRRVRYLLWRDDPVVATPYIVMEVRMRKRDFLESLVQGGIFSKGVKNGAKQAMELRVNLAKIG